MNNAIKLTHNKIMQLKYICFNQFIEKEITESNFKNNNH